MSDIDSSFSKLNGSSGFISYEESKRESWSMDRSANYALQNKRNHKRLIKRRNSKIFDNDQRKETNHILLNRLPPDGAESEPAGLESAGSSTPYSAEALRTVKFYRRAKDFWNVFPKTDYVYSRHSKWYGTEVAPGIPRIPNMCRPSYRGRYSRVATSYHQEQDTSTSYTDFEESRFVRIRRIVRTSITTTFTRFFQVAKTAALPIVTAASSVVSAATSAATTVSSASSATCSWISQASTRFLSTSAGQHSDEDTPNSGNPWSLLFLLLLLLVPAVYLALHGIDLPPPYVPSIIEDLSQENLYSTLQRLYTPFASLWGGTLWLGSLLVNSLLMIPTLLTETSSILYVFFQYYATTAFNQSSIPADKPPTFAPSFSDAGPTYNELNNLKLWVSEIVSSRMKEMKVELDAGRRQPDSQKDILSALMLIRTSIKKLIESNLLMKSSVEKLQESDKVILSGIDKLEEDAKLHLQRLEAVEEGYSGTQLKIKELETSSAEDQMKLQVLLKKSQEFQVATGKLKETSGATGMSAEIREGVISIVQGLLEEYHADRTGKPDYALSSNGAAIASIRCTRPFNKRAAEYVLWGILRWEYINTPDIIIKPGFMPGECWAFEGANGYVAIQLSMPIYVSGFSLEHTPKELTPLGHIESAPRKFSVWGLSSLEDKEEEFLGRFEFEDNGKSLQSFEAVSIDRPFQLVELRIESNHGHLEYTCLYRFRVHGRPAI